MQEISTAAAAARGPIPGRRDRRWQRPPRPRAGREHGSPQRGNGTPSDWRKSRAGWRPAPARPASRGRAARRAVGVPADQEVPQGQECLIPTQTLSGAVTALRTGTVTAPFVKRNSLQSAFPVCARAGKAPSPLLPFSSQTQTRFAGLCVCKRRRMMDPCGVALRPIR